MYFMKRNKMKKDIVGVAVGLLILCSCPFVLFQAIKGIIKTKEESNQNYINLNKCLSDLKSDKKFNELIFNNQESFKKLIIIYNIKSLLDSNHLRTRQPIYINNPDKLFESFMQNQDNEAKKYFPLISLKNMEEKTYFDCNDKYFVLVLNYVINKTNFSNSLQVNYNYYLPKN